MRTGLTTFEDYEAIELLLTLAIPRRDVKPAAKLLLSRFKTFRGVLDAPLEELRQIPGLGEVAPTALRIVREAATRYLQQTSVATFSLANPQVLFDYCRTSMGALPVEHFKVIYLDTAGRIIGDETLEHGTVDRAAVYPREVLRAALHNRAASLIFVHNHPNGNVAPTEQDRTLTRALVLAATALQIKTLDHVIVSGDEVFSFRKEGLL